MKNTKEYSWDNLELDEETKNEFAILLGRNESELRLTFATTYTNLNKMIEMAYEVILSSEKNNWTDIKIIWNAIGYMLYISLESKHAIELLVYEENFDNQRLYIKNIINIIYESINDLESLLGGKLSQEVIKLGINKEILSDLKLERNKISNFKKLYFSDLQYVRNAFCGHRDHNFIDYNAIYKSIEKSSIMKLVFLYDDIVNSLGKPMTDIMNESARIKTSN
ncbi:hypothetical protein [Leptospira mtsangambouensis]|uniref:hypothetical protein n=1 Tax=Leptospira mtsangambouensis TaxID=2484912 RepID=UPI001EECCBB2|nr:hypothetical protein [Leptospira mtsangambouensis]MCG6142834.1 hypothetical protein [Leptospira mtsangambouensis]